jgi:hypothetical protein
MVAEWLDLLVERGLGEEDSAAIFEVIRGTVGEG